MSWYLDKIKQVLSLVEMLMPTEQELWSTKMTFDKTASEIATLQDYEDAAFKTDITVDIIRDYLDPLYKLTAWGGNQDCLTSKEQEMFNTARVRLLELQHRMLLWYNVLGMVGEAGEIANKIKKVLRDGKYEPLDLAKESGDVLWYVTRFAQTMAFNLSQVAVLNIKKLKDRKEKGTLKGEGDNR